MDLNLGPNNKIFPYPYPEKFDWSSPAPNVDKPTIYHPSGSEQVNNDLVFRSPRTIFNQKEPQFAFSTRPKIMGTTPAVQPDQKKHEKFSSRK